jgi:hypothetical protein
MDGSNSTGTVAATVAESVAAHNGSLGNAGLYAASGAGHAPIALSLFHSVSANNGYGIVADGTGVTIRLAQSQVTGNPGYGWYANNGGVIASYGDNYIDGNGSSVGSLTPISKQ